MIGIEAAGRSHSGRVRPENEDHHALVTPSDPALRERKGHLLVVADGLGGHEAGQVASATAVHGLVDAYYASTSPSRVEPALQHAVQVANLRVHDVARQNSSYRSMQTTLSSLVLAGASAYIAHVGDSRIYLIRAGTLTQLTNDHSEAAELVRLRLVRQELLDEHPRRNVLTRTIGSNILLRPDYQRLPVQEGDTFVLCTDGLWSEVNQDEITRVATTHSPENACQKLLDLQLARASLDNATALVVKVLSVESDSAESDGWLNSFIGRIAGSRSDRRR